MHACDIRQSPIFNLPKRVLYFFAKYYSRQYFILAIWYEYTRPQAL